MRFFYFNYMIRFETIMGDGIFSQTKVRGMWSKRDNN